jgi:multicomponent Na+:H+ antiporter subunit B
MKSIILATTSRYVQPILLIYSIFMLFRGHNAPGGGFVGGLIVAAAFALYILAYGSSTLLAVMKVHPKNFIAPGLLLAVGSACIALFRGQPFMTGQWGTMALGDFGKLKVGTPVFFDIGVYLVVLGVAILIIKSYAKE